jgi:hypothetical protein
MDAFTVQPTILQFSDFDSYIGSKDIQNIGSKFGFVKVIPPAGIILSMFQADDYQIDDDTEFKLQDWEMESAAPSFIVHSTGLSYGSCI